MNKWKKVGLTALSASLMSVSANAGTLDVTGGASITFHSDQDTTGNPWSQSSTVVFSGAGDLDNGWTMNWSYAMSDAAYSSMSTSIGMGDGGTLKFGKVAGGVQAYDNVIPTAKEESYDDLAGEDNAKSGISTANAFAYSGSFAGVDVSVGYAKNGSSNASDSSIGASYTFDDLGLTIGYAAGEDGKTIDETVAYVKYVIGGATLAYSKHEKNVSSSATDDEIVQYGGSFAVNENLSVSYGKTVVDFEDKTSDQESTGVSASYTMGSITIAAALNDEENTGGTSGSKHSMAEVSVSFAF